MSAMSCQFRMVAFIAVIAFVVAGCHATRPDPRLVRGTTPEEFWVLMNGAAPNDRHAIIDRKYSEFVGKVFPDLVMIDKNDQVVRFSSLRGERVAVLWANTACPTSRKWLHHLHSMDWKTPDGFDRLIVLVRETKSTREWRALMKACPVVYVVGYPLQGYLAWARAYPIMFQVNPEGVIEGYKWPTAYPQLMELDHAGQPNSALKPARTPLAVASGVRAP